MKVPPFRKPLVVRMMVAAAKGWSKDNVPRLGASLAYYTLFAVGPILIIVIAIAGAIFGPEAVRGEIVGQIDQLVGTEGARAVQDLLESASKDRSGTLAVIIGTLTLLLAATGAFLELQHALNVIFRVKTDPGKSGLTRLLITRLRSFGMVVSIGFVLLVSLAVSAALAAVSGRLAPMGAPVILQIGNVVVSLAVVTLLFAMIYRLLPDVRLEWREVWTGAFVTALLFTIGKQLIGLYPGRSSVASGYGAAGSVVVLLLWVYYTAQIVLFGAELTRVYAEHYVGTPPPNNVARRDPNAHPSAPKT
ncbi:MAG: YihY/virulence factor BrkB family protein [Gemmatimonadales bacterium]|nr:YihY/virulence factor BrkB family protein [Gemmatimonadales bacterium]